LPAKDTRTDESKLPKKIVANNAN